MTDIPLEKTVLRWSPAREGASPSFQVLPLGDKSGGVGALSRSGGAVYLEWKEADPKDRLLMLFGEIMTIMARDGIPFDIVHGELMKIPEYRDDVLASDVPTPVYRHGEDR